MSDRLLHDVCLDYASNKYVVDADPKRWTTFIRDCFVTDKYIYLLCPEGEQSSLVMNGVTYCYNLILLIQQKSLESYIVRKMI